MNPTGPAPIHALRHKTTVRTGGSRLTAFFFAVLALVVGLSAFLSPMLVFWQQLTFALLLGVVSVLVDVKKQPISICGQCGNEVAPTSMLCPHCQARLSAAPVDYGRHVTWALLTLLLISAAIYGIRYHEQWQARRAKAEASAMPGGL